MSFTFTENEHALLVAVFKGVKLSGPQYDSVAKELGITTKLLSVRMSRFRAKIGLSAAASAGGGGGGVKKESKKATTGAVVAATPKRKAAGVKRGRGKKSAAMVKEECDGDEEEGEGRMEDGGGDGDCSEGEESPGGNVGMLGERELFSARGHEYGGQHDDGEDEDEGEETQYTYSANAGRKRSAASDMGGPAKRMPGYVEQRAFEQHVLQEDYDDYYDEPSDEEGVAA